MKWLVLVVIILVAIFFFSEEDGNVSVLAEYPEKVVYTTDISVDQKDLILDCMERDGIFNSCGSPCSLDEEFCVAVCAYTCDFTN
ncbi:MAG: hypothetical protein MRY49_02830 [Candidatus Pacebacteria bacterium]|nr:hypothetical protein [Candidatus Paceibacterota bacterium]